MDQYSAVIGHRTAQHRVEDQDVPRSTRRTPPNRVLLDTPRSPLSALTPPATATSRLGQVPCESADKSGARARERAHLTGPRLRGTPQSTCPARPSPSRLLRAGRPPKPTRPAQNAGPWKSVRSAASTIAPHKSARMVKATGPNPRRRDAEVEKRQGEETGEAATYEGPADVAVGEHAHGSVDVSDVLVVHVDAPDPSCAAHFAFDVDGRTVGKCCDGRCRVSRDLERERYDDPCFVEAGVDEVSIRL